MNTYIYQAWGLTLSLPLPCPILRPASPQPQRADIDVMYGKTPTRLDSPIAQEPHWQAESQRFLYRMGRYGRYLVEDGRYITVTRHSAIEDADVCLHLLYACLAIAMQQRGLFVLHANTIRIQDQAVAIAGDSGAGKSTLLASLIAEGHPMLADDVTVIDAPEQAPMSVRSGFPHYKLCLDAANQLGIATNGTTPVRWQQRKVGIQAAEAEFSPKPSPLAAIFILATYKGTAVQCTELSGITKFEALRRHTYGPDGIGISQRQSPIQMQVAATVPVFHLLRPQIGWSLDALSAQIKHQLAQR